MSRSGEERHELWPRDERTRAEVLRWMFFEQYSHEPTLAVLRYLRRYVDRPADHAHRIPELEAGALRVLSVLDTQLRARPFVAGSEATLADYALYPYRRWAGEAGVDLGQSDAVVEWLARVESLPAFLPLRVDGADQTISFETHFGLHSEM